jgi:hypothetical protein
MILTQLFWISFILIGLAITNCLKRRNQFPAPLKDEIIKIDKTNYPLRIVVRFAVGVLCFAPLIFVGYLLQLPVNVLSIFYVITLALALGYSLRLLIINFTRVRQAIKAVTFGKLFVVAGVMVVLIADYGFSLKYGGGLESDSPVHVARVASMAHDHLTLVDPYFGQNGVVDPRYSINLVGALQASLVSMGSVSPVDVWVYSASFFKSVFWLALYGLTMILLPRNVRKRWGLYVLVALPLVHMHMFDVQYAIMPDRVTWIWGALLLVGIIFWLRNSKNHFLLMSSSVLIAMTHALFSLISAGFVLLLLGALHIFTHQKISRSRQLLISAGILVMPVLLNLYYPNRTALSDRAFNAGVLKGSPVNYDNIGSIFFHAVYNPINAYLGIGIAVLFAYYLFIKRLRNHALRRVLASGWFFACTFVYVPFVASCIACVRVFQANTNERIRIFIGCIFFYYALIIYNPLLITVLHDKIPPWVIGRFQEFNLLSLVFPIIAAFIVVDALIKLIDYKKYRVLQRSILYLVAINVLSIWPVSLGFMSLSALKTDSTTDDYSRVGYAHRLEGIKYDISDGVTLSATENSQYIIPTIKKTNAVSTIVTNFAPMANIPMRQQCLKTLTSRLNNGDMQVAKITYVIVDDRDVNDSSFNQRVEQDKTMFNLVEKANGLSLYKYKNPSKVLSDTEASDCNIPDGQ